MELPDFNPSVEPLGMHFQTILNLIEPHKSFVYDSVTLTTPPDERPHVAVTIRARKNGRPICSGCGRRGPTYDHLPMRQFEYVPFWGLAVYFVYALRRVNCKACGVTAERVPWSDGNSPLTIRLRWFLANWARRLSWSEVALLFGTSWDSVCRAVEHAVAWGLKHRDLAGLTALGIDEVAWRKGHTYLTLLYDISGSAKRLLAVIEHRTVESLRAGLAELGSDALAQVQFVCSDMWRPYLRVIREQLSHAVHVLDRFHVMKLFGKALDQIRADETGRLKRDGYEPILKHSRWCLLKRPENLTDKQTVTLGELLRYNLSSVRAYLLREDFQRFWSYVSPAWAGKFLDEWTARVMRSRLEPLKQVARTLRGHRAVLLNWFAARGEVSAGAVEGLNNKVKLITRKSYGFRTAKVAKLALLHNLGRLPEQKFTHEFC
jgi:transposase